MSEPGYHAENHPRHIDRKALYTDLEARIDYLQRFLDFNAGWCPPGSSPQGCLRSFCLFPRELILHGNTTPKLT